LSGGGETPCFNEKPVLLRTLQVKKREKGRVTRPEAQTIKRDQTNPGKGILVFTKDEEEVRFALSPKGEREKKKRRKGGKRKETGSSQRRADSNYAAALHCALRTFSLGGGGRHAKGYY